MSNRKVAVVGMGGAFPACKDIAEFSSKLFTNKSLIRTWDETLAYGKQVRSNIAGFITEEEMGLEVVWNSSGGVNYPDAYIDTLNRIPPGNLATADVGSVWAMPGSLD